jgi:hypothetical protein
MKIMTNTVALAKTDSAAATMLKKLAKAAPEVWHGLVKPEALTFLHQHAALLTAEVVGPVLALDPKTVPEVVVSIEKTTNGHYKIGRDGLGLKWRVVMNVIYLGRPRTEVLSTLLHEILHATQEAHGKQITKAHHNGEFREWASRAGIPCNEKGVSEGVIPDSPFAAYCKRHKIDGALAPGSKMKKWTCECGVNVRCAVELDAICNDCGEPFKFNDKR